MLTHAQQLTIRCVLREAIDVQKNYIIEAVREDLPNTAKSRMEKLVELEDALQAVRQEIDPNL